VNLRRKKNRSPHVEEVGLQIAPMIDITLLLLFFFMLSNVMDPGGSRRRIELPTTSIENPDPREPASPAPALRVVLDIDGEGQLLAGDQKLAPPQLRAFFERKRELLIRADARTPAKTIQKVIRTAAESGIHRIQHSIQAP
jgi:biopolymer transport protein ExbD